jgi:hypothetical protein
MGAAKVEPDPFRVAVTFEPLEVEVEPVLDELELLLEPQALTPMARTPAVAAASHMRDMECFSFVRFICRQGR